MVARLRLESLLSSAERMGPAAFDAGHEGLFLVAMGRLSAAELRGHLAMDEDSTMPMRVGPSHDLGKHPLAGLVFHFTALDKGRPLRLGRGHACEIQVPDESVSDVHCELQVGEGALLVVDLQSTNGTSVNGVRVDPDTPNPVADGQLLTVARYTFQVLSPKSLRTSLLAIRGSPTELG